MPRMEERRSRTAKEEAKRASSVKAAREYLVRAGVSSVGDWYGLEVAESESDGGEGRDDLSVFA